MSRVNKKTRQKIFEKYNGRCAYCGCKLPDRWHVDHIEPVRRKLKYIHGKGYTTDRIMLNPKNDVIENYNPSCPLCNILKGSLSMDSFRDMISGYVNSLNEYSNQYKMAKKYGLVQETELEVLFYFEKHRQR
jgi:5-methylcytosine-specific restriction endonuclease McrA